MILVPFKPIDSDIFLRVSLWLNGLLVTMTVRPEIEFKELDRLSGGTGVEAPLREATPVSTLS